MRPLSVVLNEGCRVDAKLDIDDGSAMYVSWIDAPTRIRDRRSPERNHHRVMIDETVW